MNWLILGQNVTSIGKNAFNATYALDAITYVGNGNVKAISYTALSEEGTYTFPPVLSTIHDYSFNVYDSNNPSQTVESNLHVIKFPASLLYLGKNAFTGHIGLTDVYCEGEEPAELFANTADNNGYNAVNSFTLVTPKPFLHVPAGCCEEYEDDITLTNYAGTNWTYYFELVDCIPSQNRAPRLASATIPAESDLMEITDPSSYTLNDDGTATLNLVFNATKASQKKPYFITKGIVVPRTVTKDGHTYTVTKIASGAFRVTGNANQYAVTIQRTHLR